MNTSKARWSSFPSEMNLILRSVRSTKPQVSSQEALTAYLVVMALMTRAQLDWSDCQLSVFICPTSYFSLSCFFPASKPYINLPLDSIRERCQCSE